MHFWTFRTHCWLHDITDETEIAGLKFKPLAIDYGPAEFQAEAEGSGFEIVACVHIEASADHPDFNAEGEARWLQAMADVSPVGNGMPQATVPFARMGDFVEAEATLREHATLPNVQGIRFNLDHRESPCLQRPPLRCPAASHCVHRTSPLHCAVIGCGRCACGLYLTLTFSFATRCYL
jgi:predicted TIM-barrel fold metal-dependent hydrolase